MKIGLTKGSVISLPILALFVLAPAAPAQTWSLTGNMMYPRVGHVEVALQDGRVLVVGGDSGSVRLNSAEIYDPSTGTWSSTGSTGVLRYASQAVRLQDGRVLICGGETYAGATVNSAEIFNPATGTWTPTGSMSAARRGGFTLTLLPSGKVLVDGGYGYGFLSSAELYDPASGTWTSTPPMRIGRWQHTATLMNDGRVLVSAGENYGYPGLMLPYADIYNPVSNTWTPTADLNNRAAHCAALLLDGRVLVAGGLLMGPVPLAGCQLYDPTSGIWSATGSLIGARYAATASRLDDGKVLIAGGTNASSALNSSELYDPASGAWTAMPNLNVARHSQTAAMLPGNRVLVAGGRGAGSQVLNSAEVFGVALQNLPPVAEAGEDRSVRLSVTVTLDGSGSYDDNTASPQLGYSWSFVSKPTGSAAILAGAGTVAPSFVADVAGTYDVQLIVTDEQGLPSAPSFVTISSDNLAPTAVAAVDYSLVITGETAHFDGSGSTDPEHDALTYSWAISTAPSGSTAAIVDPESAMATLTPDVPGVYEVTLVVSDFLGAGSPTAIAITAATAEEFAEYQVVEASGIVSSLTAVQVTTKGNQTALQNFLSQAVTALQAGDFPTTRDKLQKAMERTDGCVLRDAPDGNGPGRDWITDCAAQRSVYSALSAALETLTP